MSPLTTCREETTGSRGAEKKHSAARRGAASEAEVLGQSVRLLSLFDGPTAADLVRNISLTIFHAELAFQSPAVSLSLSSSFYFPVLSFILGKKLPASRQSSTSLACARRAFARSFGITHSLCPADDKVHCSLVVERRRRQLASDRSRRSEEGRTRNGWREASSR